MKGPQRPRIRRVETADLDAVLEIETAWDTTPHWSRMQFESELASERSYTCVAELDGLVVGYANLRIVLDEAQVNNVAVHPMRTRMGLGSALVEHLHHVARSRDCSRITLEAGAGNEPAQCLYARLGYRIVGRRPKYYNDGSDALLMGRSLEVPT
ncbi:MAG: ribosomal protein S18-alanine N-acetyltransferase [Elusimicrobia bacterium]|nr:ribosomal protein S18-alanine N-acetyltransferase [Elusimicrobiota bacterium]